MIRFVKTRIAASLFTLGVVLQPHAGHAAIIDAAAATPPIARMDHISIETIGNAQGTPVLLIPGLSSPRAVWGGVAPRLAKGHRVMSVQVNGFGGDDAGANTGPGVLDGVVADLHAISPRTSCRARPWSVIRWAGWSA